jgi:hypothetical protein
MADPFEPPLPVEDHIHEMLSFTTVDHPPEQVHPLGNEEVLKVCVGRMVAYCAAAFVTHRAATRMIASEAAPARIMDDARKKLKQFFIRVSGRKSNN